MEIDLNCPACKEPFADRGTFQYASGSIICYPCHEKATPTRIARAKLRPDEYRSKVWADIREAVKQRDEIRASISSIKTEAIQSGRSIARDEIVTAICRMSFWKRLRLVFNPFGVTL